MSEFCFAVMARCEPCGRVFIPLTIVFILVSAVVIGVAIAMDLQDQHKLKIMKELKKMDDISSKLDNKFGWTIKFSLFNKKTGLLELNNEGFYEKCNRKALSKAIEEGTAECLDLHRHITFLENDIKRRYGLPPEENSVVSYRREELYSKWRRVIFLMAMAAVLDSSEKTNTK